MNLSYTPTRRRKVLTVDGQVDPGAVDVTLGLGISVYKYDSALVPPLVASADIIYTDRGLFHQGNALLKPRINVRRVAVKLDEDGDLGALLPPLDDVFVVLAVGVGDFTLQNLGPSNCR